MRNGPSDSAAVRMRSCREGKSVMMGPARHQGRSRAVREYPSHYGTSEAGQVGMRNPPAMHAQPPKLGTAVQCRHGLAGVEQAALIERALDGMEDLELAPAELHAHLLDLLHADAMLAADAAAFAHAELENLAAEGLRPGEFVRDVGIEEDQRVQIAVAGMEDVGAAQAVFALHPADRLQHRRE